MSAYFEQGAVFVDGEVKFKLCCSFFYVEAGGAKNSKIMINITFPDGSVKPFEEGVTGYQIAEGISPRLASVI